MRYIFAGFAAVCLSILIAACGGSVGPAPAGGVINASPGQQAASSTSQTYTVTTTGQFSLAAPSIGGNQANIQFQAATGGPSTATMTVSTSSTMPNGLQPLSKARMPASLRSVKDFTYSAQWFYDVIASASLTFAEAPAWSVTVAQPIAGASYFIAYYDPTIPGWNIYGGGTPQGTPGPTSTNVTYLFTPAAVASPMVIPTGSPGANFALVAITGTTPTPVPTPTPIPSYPDLVADNNFTTEGTAGQWALNSTGWTPCSNPEETPTPRPTATQAVAPSFQTTLQTGANPQPTPYGGVQYAALIGRASGTTSPDEPRGAYGICQQVTIPSNPYMTMAVLEGGNDGSAYIGQKASLVVGGTLTLAADSTPTNPYYVISGATSEVSLFSDYVCTGMANGQAYNNCTGTPSTPAWVVKGPYTTQLQSLEGQTVILFIGVWGKSGDSGNTYGVFMYVDNVVLVNLP